MTGTAVAMQPRNRSDLLCGLRRLIRYYRGEPSASQPHTAFDSHRLTSDNCQTTLSFMIRNFRHRGLKRLYDKGDASKVSAQDVNKIRRILARLNNSSRPEDMDVPGFRLHPLKGDLKGFWAVTVRANWRIIFRMEGEDAHDVDLIDYH
jgi:proteic killer suppression protein